VTGIVPVGKRAPHWRFSTDAVIQAVSGDFVYVLEEPGMEGALPGARRTRVEVGFERGDAAYVPVASGPFVEGDRVMVEGNERLAPGQSLIVKPRGQPAAEPAPRSL
jgi:multidrug efflux pump subunit AcrA (membrane-fusion protein)